MNNLFEFYHYENKKYSKPLILLFCVFFVTLINTFVIGALAPKLLLGFSSIFMLGCFILAFKKLWLEFKKSLATNL